MISHPALLGALLLPLVGCAKDTAPADAPSPTPTVSMRDRLAKYTPVRLTADLSTLTPREQRMIPLLIDAAKAMDRVFWLEAYGSPDSLLRAVADPDARRFVEINY